uniref:SprT-like domain-containing protein n=1 Tax=Picocystis salinarum TaxID=88271 RepID=A0A7S3UES1_9CHLO
MDETANVPEAMKGKLGRWTEKKTPGTAKRRLGTARCAVDAEMEPIPVNLLSPNVTFRKVRKDGNLPNKDKAKRKEEANTVAKVSEGKENRGLQPQEEKDTRPRVNNGYQEENLQIGEASRRKQEGERLDDSENVREGFVRVLENKVTSEWTTGKVPERWDRGLKRIQEGLLWLQEDGGKDAHLILANYLERKGVLRAGSELDLLRKYVETIEGYVVPTVSSGNQAVEASTDEDYRSCRSSLGERESSSESKKGSEYSDVKVVEEDQEEVFNDLPEPRKLSFGSHTSDQSEEPETKRKMHGRLVNLEKEGNSTEAESEDEAFQVPSSRRPASRRVCLLSSDEELKPSPAAAAECAHRIPKPSPVTAEWIERQISFSTAVKFQISEEAKRFSPKRTPAVHGRRKPKQFPKSPFIDDQASDGNYPAAEESDASESYESSFINDSDEEEDCEEEEEYQPETDVECSEMVSSEVKTRTKPNLVQDNETLSNVVDAENNVGKSSDVFDETPSLVDRISRIRLGAWDEREMDGGDSLPSGSGSVSSDSEDDALNGAIIWRSATKGRRTKQTKVAECEELDSPETIVVPSPSVRTKAPSTASLVSFTGSAAAFRRERERLAHELFREYNRRVFDEQLPPELLVIWNNKLKTTAGLTHYKREVMDGAYHFSARVELSSKVVDAFPKLQRTLCHELCHVAAWLLDHTAKPPHGPVFKKWASRAMQVYPDLEISTCHHYEIHYPYRWKCGSCFKVYGRHSNSIKPEKHACGICRGRLEPMGKFKPTGSPVRKRAPSAYTSFVKAHFAQARSDLGQGVSHGAVMRHLSELWQQRKSATATSTIL